MTIKRAGLLVLLLATAGTLAACVDDGGYGYGGPAVGYRPAYYDGYEGDQYAGYPSYYGWYGNYYYPGTGFYVYDQYRRPYRWNGDQRRYWWGQLKVYRGNAYWGNVDRPNGGAGGSSRGTYRSMGRPAANWGGFVHGPGAGAGAGAGRGAHRR